MQQQHSCLVQFASGICQRLNDPFQGATLIVQSFPWSPDVLSIINAMAEQDGEPRTGTAFTAILGVWSRTLNVLYVIKAMAKQDGGTTPITPATGAHFNTLVVYNFFRLLKCCQSSMPWHSRAG